MSMPSRPRTGTGPLVAVLIIVAVTVVALGVLWAAGITPQRAWDSFFPIGGETPVTDRGVATRQLYDIVFVFAVAISNVPQGLGGSAGMLAAGWPKPKITRLWVAVCVLSIVAAALGYQIGTWIPGATGAAVDAFAAGALLVMLTDSMIPESFEHGGREAGLALVLGFAVAVAMGLAQLG